MSGTHRFLIQKHHTDHPHYDLKMEFGESMKLWILPNRIPSGSDIKTIAIEMEDRAFGPDGFMTPMDDQYGTGETEIWDRGDYNIISRTDQKIELNAKGKRFRGRFVFITPSWGRWTARRLWLVIKIYGG